MDNRQLEELRRDYSSHSLLETSVASDPFAQFSTWMDETIKSEVIDANAMTVSTVDEMGRPSSRIVLLKGFDHNGFIFFTNYNSNKAADLEANPNIVMHFFWPDLQRQTMITGMAAKTTREVSEAYFATRPVESKIGAWASEQSSVLTSRKELESRVAETQKRFAGQPIPCPPFWGGFCVTPRLFEFWQGGANRLHDRICYTLDGTEWKISRLSP